MMISNRLHLGRSRMLAFLDELGAKDAEALSLYLPRSTTVSQVEECVKKVFPFSIPPSGILEIIAGSHTGAAIFWGLQNKYVVLPPFPIVTECVSEGYDVDPLRSLLSRDFLIALVLVRMGSYSIGICRGTEIMDSRTGTGLVHARHKKGGSSQGRFARHREKQIESFLGRVCDHARERIAPHTRSLDYLVYGGARTTILSLRKQCAFLRQFDDRILRMLLDIPNPRRSVLEDAVTDVWTTTIIELHDDGA